MNLFEKGSKFIMGVLSGNPQNEPLHYGEVYGLWSHLSATKAGVDTYQVYINHTGDEELRAFLKQVIENSMKPAIKEIEEVLLHNDIAVPPTPSERPEADLEQIPAGARLQDVQIAYMVAAEIAAGVTTDAALMSQSIREDIGTMLASFGAKKSERWCGTTANHENKRLVSSTSSTP